jgi:uncharacterized protein (TIRG00374 family)
MTKKNTIYSAGIIVSLVFIYLLFKNTNVSEILKNIASINISSLILIPLLTLFIIALKTFRWKKLLDKSDNIPYRVLLPIGYMSNFLNIIFPFRAGEVAQIFLTKSYTRISRSNIAGSLFLNKFMEIISMLILFYPLTVFVSIPALDFLITPIRYLLIFTIIFLLLFAFNIIDIKKHKQPTNKVMGSLYRFLMSLKHIEDKGLLIKSILISLFVWLIELVKIYLLLNAFGIDVPFWATILVTVGINLAMLIPATSGSFGPYEYAIILVLGIFAVPKEKAVAFAITLHFLEIILVLIIGFIFYLRIKKNNPVLAEKI